MLDCPRKSRHQRFRRLQGFNVILTAVAIEGQCFGVQGAYVWKCLFKLSLDKGLEVRLLALQALHGEGEVVVLNEEGLLVTDVESFRESRVFHGGRWNTRRGRQGRSVGGKSGGG